MSQWSAYFFVNIFINVQRNKHRLCIENTKETAAFN